MKFDARSTSDSDARAAFIEWLVSETASGLVRSRGDVELLKAPVFLYLNRAYEAHLDPDLIADLIGASERSILDRAGLSDEEEQAVINAYESLVPTIEAMYDAA